MLTFSHFQILDSEGGSSTVNVSGDIKFDATGGRNKSTKIDKLIDTLDVLAVNAARKTAFTRQTLNLGVVGVYLRFDFACLFCQIQSHLAKISRKGIMVH